MSHKDDAIQDFVQFANEFKSETDRAAVVLGAAKLDMLLYQVLGRVLRPVPGKKDDLLDGDSPLSTFSSRIMMCQRLGLIDDEFARSLHLLRKIRNSFAHELSGVSLNSGPHKDRVKELVTPFRKHGSVQWLLDNYFKDAETASEFRAIVALLCVRLEGLFENAESLVYNNPYKVLPSNWNDGRPPSREKIAPPPAPAPSK